MTAFIRLLAACTSQIVSNPWGREVPYPCAMDDAPVVVGDDDATYTGFSATEAVDLLDGFVLEATYDLEKSADPSVESELIGLQAVRTDEPVEYVDRARTPPSVMGGLPGGVCLLGPLLRVPVTVRWPMQTPDGSVGWWVTDQFFEFGSAVDPTQIEVFVNVAHYSLDDMDPVLADYVGSFISGDVLEGAYLTAGGTLAAGDWPSNLVEQGFAIEVITESWEQTQLRKGNWRASEAE